MLAQVGGLLGEVGRIVRAHHERYDGTGYPDRLSGEQIPLIARIVSCCDAFNAMTTNRPYRKALPVETAIAELREQAGGQFDPTVVEALVNAVTQPRKAA
jgi:HD-GYP domain-containing protein (c-di-GMP phosphodiesterase class II)